MPTLKAGRHPASSRAVRFVTTQWTLVMRAKDQNSPGARQALSSLCITYRDPLYAFLCDKGYQADAADLIQGFVDRVQSDPGFLLKNVDREKGRFRSLLRKACENYAHSELRRRMRKIRGGDRRHVPIDLPTDESHHGIEPVDSWTPEREYDRRCLLAILHRTLDRVQRRYQKAGDGELYDRLMNRWIGGQDREGYRQIGAALEMGPGAVKMAAKRLRDLLRKVFREEVEDTVGDPSHVDEEIRELLAGLGL